MPDPKEKKDTNLVSEFDSILAQHDSHNQEQPDLISEFDSIVDQYGPKRSTFSKSAERAMYDIGSTSSYLMGNLIEDLSGALPEKLTQFIDDHSWGDTSTEAVDRYKGISKNLDAKGPQLTQEEAESWEGMLGSAAVSFVPSATGVALSAMGMPQVGVPLAEAGFSGLAFSSAGSALKEYDRYAEEKGLDPRDSQLERYSIATANAAVEYATERLGVAGPLMDLYKGTKPVLKAGVKESVDMGKDIIKKYAKANPTGYKQAMKKIVAGASREGAGEASAELMQSAIENWYKDVEDNTSFGEMLDRSWKAGVIGFGMGAGLGPVSYSAQNTAERQRREKQKFVRLGKLGDESVEVLRRNAGEDGGSTYSVMFSDGRVKDVPETDIGETVDLGVDQFYNVLKGKVEENTAIEESRLEGQRQQRDQILQEVDDAYGKFTFSDDQGNEFVHEATYDDIPVFVVGQNPKDPEMMYIVDQKAGGSVPKAVDRSRLGDVTVTALSDIKRGMLGDLANIPESADNAPQVGETLVFGNLGEGKIISYDPRNGEASVSFETLDAEEGVMQDAVQFTRDQIEAFRTEQPVKSPEIVQEEAQKATVEYDKEGNPVKSVENYTKPQSTGPNQNVPQMAQFELEKETIQAVQNGKSFEVDNAYTQKQAEKVANEINENYPNSEAVVENRTAPGIGSKADFRVVINERGNQSSSDQDSAGDGATSQKTKSKVEQDDQRRSRNQSEVSQQRDNGGRVHGSDSEVQTPEPDNGGTDDRSDSANTGNEIIESNGDRDRLISDQEGNSKGQERTESEKTEERGSESKKKKKQSGKENGEDVSDRSESSDGRSDLSGDRGSRGVGSKENGANETDRAKKDITDDSIQRTSDNSTEQDSEGTKGKNEKGLQSDSESKKDQQVSSGKTSDSDSNSAKQGGSGVVGKGIGSDDKTGQVDAKRDDQQTPRTKKDKGTKLDDKPKPKSKADDSKVGAGDERVVKLANEYIDAKDNRPDLSPVEKAIVDFGGIQTSQDSFNRFGDKNNITQSLAKSYLRKQGRGLDVIAQEINDQFFEGNERVTPEDLVDYMVSNPNGVDELGDTARGIASEYKELTGKTLNILSAKSIAKKYRLKEAEVNSIYDQVKNRYLMDNGEIDFNEFVDDLENHPEIFELMGVSSEEIVNLSKEVQDERSKNEPSSVENNGIDSESDQEIPFQRSEIVDQAIRQSIPQVPHLKGTDETNVASRYLRPFVAENKQRIEKVVAKTLKGWKNAPEVKVWESVLDFVFSYPAVASQITNPYQISGVFHDDKIHIIASHNQFQKEEGVLNTILHESVGHYGLRGMFERAGDFDKKEFNSLLDEVTGSYADTELYQALSKRYFGKDVESLTKTQKRVVSEEYIAHVAQEGTNQSLIDKIVAWLRKLWQNATGSPLKFSDVELKEILASSRAFLKTGNALIPRQPMLAYSRGLDPALMQREGNQEARFQKAPPTDSEAFKKWFGDSKVVDENGEPLVVYHGTNADFSEFKHGKSFGSGDSHLYLGKGFYFTNDLVTADSYADSGGNVIEAFVSLQNPYISDKWEHTAPSRQGSFARDLGVERGKEREYLESQGYDGVISTSDDGYVEVVAFSPTQIKSATGNRGTYDANNPDIRFQRKTLRPYTPSRRSIPSVRGGWNQDKIRNYLKSTSTDTLSTIGASKLIVSFENAKEFGEHVYYHGTPNYPSKGLKPSITMSERDAERYGGGGYGERYWGISLTKDKRTAESFSGQSRSVTVYPVILKPDANVIERTDLQDASDIEDIIVDLYEQGVDAVWIGGGEQELVVVNPKAAAIYKKGSDSYQVFGGFKSENITPEKVEGIYNEAERIINEEYPKWQELTNRVDRDNFASNIPTIRFQKITIFEDYANTGGNQEIREGALQKERRDTFKDAYSYIRTGIEAAQGNEQITLQHKNAKEYAQKNGLWIDDLSDLGTVTDYGGMENQIAINVEKGEIYKSNNLLVSKGDILSHINYIQRHNHLFPNTPYDLVGFQEVMKNKQPWIKPIVKQKFITGEGVRKATQEEIDTHMKSRGYYSNDRKSFSYENTVFEVSDLKPANVLFKDGELFVIDDISKKFSQEDVRFQLSKPIEESGDLVAMHNISAGGILNATKIGGLPMPSLAITKRGLQFENFGEVSLIADKSMIDPKGSGNRTFGADVYSPRYPSITYFPNQKQIESRFGEYESDMPKDWKSSTSKLLQDMEDRGIEAAKYNPLVRTAYLKETGKSLPKLRVQPKTWVLPELLSYVKAKKNEGYYDDHSAKLDDDIKPLIIDHYKEKYKREGLDTRDAEMITPTLDELKEKPYLISNTFRQEIDKALNPKIEYKTSEWFRALDYKIGHHLDARYKRFEKWVDEQFSDIDIDEKIFNGHTYSGNKRWLDHNIENVMKKLKADIRGGEGGSYGVGMARAAYTPQFKSIAQIRKAKDQLVSSEQFEKIKEEINDEFFDLAEKYPKSGNSFGHADRVINFLVDAGKNGMRREMREYGFDLSESTIEDTREFIEKLRNFPTEYFESKPNRVVQFDEFRAAVVPKGFDKDAEQILKNAGLKIQKYDSKVEGDRTEKMNQFLDKKANSDIRFQRSGNSEQFNSDNFYSNSLKSLSNIAQNKATGDQWKAMLLKNGASEAELKWIGFDEFLKDNPKPTKEEVQDFIDSKNVEAIPYEDRLVLTKPGKEQPIKAYKFQENDNQLVFNDIIDEYRNNIISYAALNGYESVKFGSDEVIIDERVKHNALRPYEPLFQRVETVQPTSETFTKKRDKWIATWQDRFIYLKRLQQLKYSDKQIADELNAYDQENLSKGIILEQIRVFKEGLWNDLDNTLIQINKESGLNSDASSRYLKAKHIVEDNIEKGGISMAEAKKIVKEFEAGTKRAGELRDHITKINQFILDKQLESGLISKTSHEKLVNFYKFYVPLRGFNEADFDPTIFTRDYKRKGRTSESGDPMAYLGAMAQTAIVKGERNKVLQALHRFIVANPDSKIYKLRNAYYIKDKDTGKLLDVVHDRPKKEDFEKYDVSLTDPSIDDEAAYDLYRQKTAFERENVTVKIGGKTVAIEFIGEDGKQIAKAIKNESLEKTPKLLSVVGNYTRLLRMAYTQYSPEFAIRNFIRDTFTAIINVRTDWGTKTGLEVAGNIPKSINTVRKWVFSGKYDESTKDGRYLKEFVESGAKTGYSVLKTVEDIRKDIQRSVDGIKKTQSLIGKVENWQELAPFQFLNNVNEMFENATRFSAYKTMRNQGMSPQQAAMYAKDLTVNFNRKGNISDLIGNFYLFFNASVQGVDRLARPFVSGSKKQRIRATSNALLTLPAIHAMMMLMNKMWWDKDEDGEYYYDKLPEYVRTHNLTIPNFFSDKPGSFFHIPLPYGFNVFFTWPENVMAMVEGRQSVADTALKTAALTSESFSPLGAPNFEGLSKEEAIAQYMAPTAAKPFIDVLINRNFAGNPIYKEPYPGQLDPPASQQYFNSVNPILRDFTDMLNSVTGGDTIQPGGIDINPEKLEHFITSWTGGVGKFIMNSLATGENLLEGKNPLGYEDDLVRKTPFARNYTSQVSEYWYQSKFYDLVEEVETKRDILNKYKKIDREKAKNYRELNKDALRMYSVAKNYSDKVKELRNREKALEALGREEEAQKAHDQMNLLFKKYIKLHNEKLEDPKTDWRDLLGI